MFIDTPLEICESRDPKGLYKKARSGEITQFTGVSDPYEPPTDPEITISTEQVEPPAAAEQICTALKKRSILD